MAKVCIGTYDKQVYGMQWPPGEEPTTLFAFSAHLGCVKCVASCGKYLASGATDENIRVFNLDKQTDLGTLFHHTGTVTALGFHGKSHMFSGSEDGQICIWRTRDWEQLSTLSTQEAVVQIALHSSGRLLLATYKSRGIRMWDLTKGRCTWKKTLPKVGEQIAWAPSSTTEFVVASGNTVSCYQDGELQHTMEHESAVLGMVFDSEHELVICGNADGKIHMWDVKSGSLTAALSAHTERVRALELHQSDDGFKYLISLSSNGVCKMWELASPKLLRLVQEHQVDVRATAMCLAVHPVEIKPATRAPSKTKPKSILKKQELTKSITKKPKQTPRSTDDTSKSNKKGKKKKKAQ